MQTTREISIELYFYASHGEKSVAVLRQLEFFI